MRSIVHIAPQLPPAVDGVGDYCWNLWRHWPEPMPEWKFVVARGAEATAQHWPEVEARAFERGAGGLREALEKARCATAVLHYVGYGFQPKGVPVALPGALAEWKRAHPERRLVTMFHEMYARSSPLRSPFWVAPVARRIIQQLVSISDSWVTSCEKYFAQLTTEFGARPELGRAIPIGSNIARVPEPDDRRRSAKGFRFILFGLARSRLWALERHEKLLRALPADGVLHSVTLLGKPNAPQDERAWRTFKARLGAEASWNMRFNLSADEISRELLAHDFGLLANEPDTLTKSGVFAAFAAHGVIPVIASGKSARWAPPWAGVVIVDDESGNIAEWRQFLSDSTRPKNRRERLLALAARELSWARITESWHGLLEPRANEEPHRFSAISRSQPGQVRAGDSPTLAAQP